MTDPQTDHPPITPPPVYSIFPKWQKRWIVFLAAFAGWFSTMSSTVYFPIITALAKSLNCSVSQINLTITSYLVVSAIAPAITSGLADASGRRPVFIVALLIYVAANVGLALQRSYAALLVLRMVQSAGISGVFALAYGVVADIAGPAERGGYVGIMSFCTNTAPALGPVIGALLLDFLGWTSIFWFLAIASSLCLILVIFTLPETARNVVGNGSVAAHGIYSLPFSKHPRTERRPSASSIQTSNSNLTNSLACLTLLLNKQNAILIYAISILYTTLICSQASLSSLFIEHYGFTNLQAGLVYIPFGFGSAIAAFLSGRLLNRDYRVTALAYGFPVNKTRSKDSHLFPIAKARMRSVGYSIVAIVALITFYGWSLHLKLNIGIVLTVQFFIGASIQVTFTGLNTLLLDLNSLSPSSVQAACNLVRCTLAALGIGVLGPLLDAIGTGWFFTFVALLLASTAPGLVALWERSLAWRVEEFNESEREPLLR